MCLLLQWVRDLQPLVQDQLLYASELPLAEQETFHDVLRNILVPRTVGSPGHRKVRQFLQQSMEQLDWHVEEDRFEAQHLMATRFSATLSPPWTPQPVIAWCWPAIMTLWWTEEVSIRQLESIGRTFCPELPRKTCC
ncbi:glutaminyl-peptide cyclotransferase-like [Rhipicephalus sanguineus]|uniref:glutaminyl-peptide cyclotransferase-like n=1 Tax=Rhipicephalus sanguineus TaxID=34632 RepID=UPI0020C50DB3|nr:glutaminyl-peptide cyclotransferase-like [Rhipicephalus sanguineus]